MKTIDIRGARTHNLKNIDVSLPREKLIVFTEHRDTLDFLVRRLGGLVSTAAKNACAFDGNAPIRARVSRQIR